MVDELLNDVTLTKHCTYESVFDPMSWIFEICEIKEIFIVMYCVYVR